MVDESRSGERRRPRWTLAAYMIVIAIIALVVAVLRPIDLPPHKAPAKPRRGPTLDRVYDSSPFPSPGRAPTPGLSW